MEILAASGTPDGTGFHVEYREGKQEYVAFEPYTEELYKKLIPYLGYA